MMGALANGWRLKIVITGVAAFSDYPIAGCCAQQFDNPNERRGFAIYQATPAKAADAAVCGVLLLLIHV